MKNISSTPTTPPEAPGATEAPPGDNAPLLPAGYHVEVDGNIATMTTPDGMRAQFDGRIIERGKEVAKADAGRAEHAAIKAAELHAAYHAKYPIGQQLLLTPTGQSS